MRARVCAVRSHVSNAVSYLGIRPCLSEFELQLEHLLFELYALELGLRSGGLRLCLMRTECCLERANLGVLGCCDCCGGLGMLRLLRWF